MRFGYAAVAATALAFALPSAAQGQRGTGRRQSTQAGRAGALGAQRAGQGGRAMDREEMRQRITRAYTHAVRTRVGLSDDQMHKLAPINRKFVQQRMKLAEDERGVRLQLRDALASPSPDPKAVAGYSAQLQDIAHQRLALTDAEEKELAGIMTPVQLARFRALQERVQRQLEAMREREGGGGALPLTVDDSSGGGGTRLP
ncbi:MAG TPA: hypothetical protein VFK16_02140 [Gemmatimonadaceae bacterium]|jgi:hypothetical protein|nr:hypothetical protein [Gemmatimonadaceae bacterium]